MHIHMNLVGGIAGDMFIAAVLDLFPDLEQPMLQTLSDVEILHRVAAQSVEYNDSVLRGKKFTVQGTDSNHHHARFVDIHKLLRESKLNTAVRQISCELLKEIAVAERHRSRRSHSSRSSYMKQGHPILWWTLFVRPF